MATSVITIGGEQRVGSPMITDQAKPQVTYLADGGWVVTWQADSVGGEGIYQRRYDKWGTLQGDVLLVSIDETMSHEMPGITALSDGGWLVVWDATDGLYQRRYSASGAAHGEATLVPTTGGGDTSPQVTGLADGGWVVTWDGAMGIQQVRYSASGTPGGVISVSTNLPADRRDPDISALADGGWVVTWTTSQASAPGDDGFNIYQRVYNANGSARGAEAIVNSTAAGDQTESSVTALAGGGWVVTWKSLRPETSEYSIYQQQYNASGIRVGGEIPVNSTGSAEQPSVTATADGGWIATWQAANAGGSGTDIYQQVYTSSGSALLGENFRVNTKTGGDQEFAHVTILANGGWIVTWESDGQDGSEAGIHQQHYELPIAPGDIGLGGSGAVSELAADGSLVGALSALDSNLNESFTFTLLDNAGGRFALGADGQSVVVANGLLLDYEQASSHTIRVRVTDKDNLSFEKTIAVQVGDIAAETAFGSMGDDVLVGGNGRDWFHGSAGNDTLWGGYGNDTLTGGTGHDIFVFSTKLGSHKTDRKVNYDRITDFKVQDDTIWLDNAIFKKLGKKGSVDQPAKLKSSYFEIGSGADDKNDYLIYNKKTGILSYDADGSGFKKAIEIARLDKNLKLTHKDFFIV